MEANWKEPDWKETNWKEADRWGKKEFISLLLLELIVGVVLIKFVVHSFYTHLFNHDLYALTLMGLTIAIVLLLGVYLIALRPKKLSWREVGLKPFAKNDWKLILLYTFIFMVGVVVIMWITSFFGNTWENSKTEAIQQENHYFTFILTFLAAAVLSPIYEEIFYRGFIYRWLRTRVGFTGALLLSSFIFMIIHTPTYNVFPVTFFGGILFALAYEKTNSILPSMWIHGLSNAIMVVLASL